MTNAHVEKQNPPNQQKKLKTARHSKTGTRKWEDSRGKPTDAGHRWVTSLLAFIAEARLNHSVLRQMGLGAFHAGVEADRW